MRLVTYGGAVSLDGVLADAKSKRSTKGPPMRTYVFSRTHKDIPDPDTRLVADDAVKFFAISKGNREAESVLWVEANWHNPCSPRVWLTASV
jgi:hypothetical protein